MLQFSKKIQITFTAYDFWKLLEYSLKLSGFRGVVDPKFGFSLYINDLIIGTDKILGFIAGQTSEFS